MKTVTHSLLILAAILLGACSQNDKNFDASGAFEADETIISSEASGVIKQLNLEEGQQLKAGQWIGYIDSTQLYLKKLQLEAQIAAAESRKPNISVQLAALRDQLKAAEREQTRVENLVKKEAATTKQLDDVNAQIDVLKSQIDAQKSALSISDQGIEKDIQPLKIQIAQLTDQIEKCKIISPMAGTVLIKYTEANEMTSPGKPLFKIADLSTITLRAYITGNQLPLIQLNQKVTVLTDNGSGGFNKTEGRITWISSKAEFTPKTIQTKDERADMVYAIKVQVVNDGTYKIGMYGELKF